MDPISDQLEFIKESIDALKSRIDNASALEEKTSIQAEGFHLVMELEDLAELANMRHERTLTKIGDTKRWAMHVIFNTPVESQA
jgi:hypothetical protein